MAERAAAREPPSADPAPVALRLEEAVELASGWAQHVARASGMRMLLIKGDSLHQHGLRAARVSADVDVLVEPERFDEFCAAVAAAGWRERPVPLISRHTSPHSRAYLRDGWPCDLDVHRFFPGFLAEPSAVFEALWTRRVTLDFAHTSVDAADRAGSILILALHSLRDGGVSARHRSELDALMELALTTAERDDLAALALQTGSSGSLADVLTRLGVEVDRADAGAESQALRAWRGRVASQSHGAYAWTTALGDARWRDRPRLVWRALWPTDRDLLISHPAVVDRPLPKLRARAHRLMRGIRGIPTSVRARRARRNG